MYKLDPVSQNNGVESSRMKTEATPQDTNPRWNLQTVAECISQKQER